MIMLIKAIELTLFPAVMAFAASSDLLTMTIANRVSIILVAGFAALAVLTGMSASGLLSHVGAAATVLVVVFVFFACGWIGGGDAKLLAACCLWFGWPDTEVFLLNTALVGGAFAFLLLLVRGQLVRPFIPAQSTWVGRLVTPGEPAPYGVAIALGALITLPASQLIRSVHISY